MPHRYSGYARPGPWRDRYGYYNYGEAYSTSPPPGRGPQDNSYGRGDGWQASGSQQEYYQPYEEQRYEDYGNYGRPAYGNSSYDASYYDSSSYDASYNTSSYNASSYNSSSYDTPSDYRLYQHQTVLPHLREREPYTNPATMKHHDDREVTPPPPRAPSPSYLAIAKEPPSPLPEESHDRKLLILDLNGTLVHRASFRPKQKDEVDEFGRSVPRLRRVHPRPYMPAFRSYLFAPETRSWLDVMIWSSAQPHSVDDMVDKCFGEAKEKLAAIWARDTLGLSAAHYNRKVQTVKDLTTPWTKLPKLLQQSRSSPSSRASTPRSDRRSPTPERKPEPTSLHSALTTLLLDDSPAKAVLQPYNHVCLPEYSGGTRAKDLECFYSERLRKQGIQDWRRDSPDGINSEQSSTPDAGQEGTGPEAVDAASIDDDTRKRKREEERKGKKQAKKAAKLAKQRLSSPDTIVSDVEAAGYDTTLLAVVGILDEIKTQKNVAAWIRAGGLWGSHLKSEAGAAKSQTPREEVPHEGGEVAGEQRADSEQNEASTREASVNAPAPAGNDAITSSSVEADEGRSQEEPTDAGTKELLWFEHPPVIEYWVSRGKEALEALAIPLEHGIVA